jgi:uncharacterized sporulation protein YeaH/YhbH (DUF444 family)
VVVVLKNLVLGIGEGIVSMSDVDSPYHEHIVIPRESTGSRSSEGFGVASWSRNYFENVTMADVKLPPIAHASHREARKVYCGEEGVHTEGVTPTSGVRRSWQSPRARIVTMTTTLVWEGRKEGGPKKNELKGEGYH